MSDSDSPIQQFRSLIDKYIDLVEENEELLNQIHEDLHSHPELLALYNHAARPPRILDTVRANRADVELADTQLREQYSYTSRHHFLRLVSIFTSRVLSVVVPLVRICRNYEQIPGGGGTRPLFPRLQVAVPIMQRAFEAVNTECQNAIELMDEAEQWERENRGANGVNGHADQGEGDSD